MVPEIEPPTSSSIFQNNADLHGPGLAVDGKISETATGFFMTEKLVHSWLELPLKNPKRLIGIKITSRKDMFINSIRDVEIRAGMEPASGTGTMFTHNQKVGHYAGPAAQGETFTVMFDKTVLAKYVTIQLRYTNVRFVGWLYVNEAVLIPGLYSRCIHSPAFLN